MASRLGLLQLGRVSRSYQGRLPRSLLVRNQSTQSAGKKSSEASWALTSLGLLGAGFYWLLSPPINGNAHTQHNAYGDHASHGGIAKQAEEGLKEIKDKVEYKVSEKSNKLEDLYQKGKDMKNEALGKGKEIKKVALEKGFDMKNEALGKGKEMKKEALEKGNEIKNEALGKVKEIKKDILEKSNEMKNDALGKGEAIKKDVKKGKGVVDSAYEQLDKAKEQVNDTVQGYKATATELSKKPSQAVDNIKEKASELIQSAKDSFKKPETPSEKISNQAKDALNKAADKAESLIGKDNVQSFKDTASDAKAKLNEYQKEVTQLIPSSVDEFTNKVSDSLPSSSEVIAQIDEVANSTKAKANEAIDYVKDKVNK